MSLFGNLFENPAIKKAAFGQLKKLMESENLGFIIVRLDADGELAFDLYKPGEAEIVVTPVEVPPGTLIGHDSALPLTTGSNNTFISNEKPEENADNQVSQ
jgi:hypothetical protein